MRNIVIHCFGETQIIQLLGERSTDMEKLVFLVDTIWQDKSTQGTIVILQETHSRISLEEVNNYLGGLLWGCGIFRWKVVSFYPNRWYNGLFMTWILLWSSIRHWGEDNLSCVCLILCDKWIFLIGDTLVIGLMCLIDLSCFK